MVIPTPANAQGFWFLADKVLLLELDGVKEGGDHNSVSKFPACQRSMGFLTLFRAGKLNKDLQERREKII